MVGCILVEEVSGVDEPANVGGVGVGDVAVELPDFRVVIGAPELKCLDLAFYYGVESIVVGGEVAVNFCEG